MTKTERVYELLKAAYPDAKCGLDYETPFQLLVSTMLSAQATDKSVDIDSGGNRARDKTNRDI